MSLIDDALKRAQEAHGRETDAARRRPWTPAPLPDRGRGRGRLAAGAAGAIAALALAAAGALFLRRPAETKPATPASVRATVATPVPPTPLPLEEVQVAPPPRGIGAAPAAKPATGQRQPPAAQAASPVAPAGPAAAPGPPAAGPAERPGSLVSGRSYAGPVVLPGGGRLELEGIVYSETNATAVINGRIVGEGASVEGFTVARIEENRVMLSGNGVTIYLTVR